MICFIDLVKFEFMTERWALGNTEDRNFIKKGKESKLLLSDHGEGLKTYTNTRTIYFFNFQFQAN